MLNYTLYTLKTKKIKLFYFFKNKGYKKKKNLNTKDKFMHSLLTHASGY